MSPAMEPMRYLEYGGVAPASSLDTAAALDYLRAKGFGDNPLEQSRDAIARQTAAMLEFEPAGDDRCDFCGRPLMGGEFDRLRDGRQRCITCSKTVVATHEEFVELFHEVRRNFEAIFELRFRVGMTVRMENAKVIARQTSERPRDAPGFDARVLGFVRDSPSGYELFVENGAPKLPTIWTLAHELTHIWQYSTWNRRAILARYGAANERYVFEGMASWASIQYMFCTRETDFALRESLLTRLRNDEYGAGCRLFAARYPLRVRDTVLPDTPFEHALPL